MSLASGFGFKKTSQDGMLVRKLWNHGRKDMEPLGRRTTVDQRNLQFGSLRSLAERKEPPSPRKPPIKAPTKKPKKPIGDPPSKKPAKRV
jgi:hypothetical protein